MPTFKKAEKVVSSKKDERGLVTIKIQLTDPKKPDWPIGGNRREVLVL